MVKRKNRSKRNLGSLPKGLPVRQGGNNDNGVDSNPFESASRHKRQKHEVVNRPSTSQNQKVASQSALARALAERKTKLKRQLEMAKKSNSFVDKRIGEYDRNMTEEQQNLARIVKERARRSKRSAKFSLDDNDDDNEPVLTHRGKAIDSLTAADHVILSDDDEDDMGQLDAVDTLQHFGGGGKNAAPNNNPYGPAGASNGGDLSSMYSSRKLELDDLIHRRKVLKAERMKTKTSQVDTFEKMDESFADLAQMLNFRDKEREIKEYHDAKRQGRLSSEDQEFADWDKEMKEYQFVHRKVKAMDRIKTPEEIAKEESERLHELETRRLARMNGDFEEDDFSDISESDIKGRSKGGGGADDLDDESDNENNGGDEYRTRFTSEGLVKIDKDGKVVGKIGEKKAPQNIHAVGTRVTAFYHAKEQMEGEETWFEGTISEVNQGKDGKVTYNVDYDDGDFEDDIEPEHIKVIAKTEKETDKEEEEKQKKLIESQKRQVAKEKARTELPYVFEVPTTLEALHDMIATHASTGKDASAIIKRIHACNSVRLNRKNSEKMQNFYDVVLRRFVAVGDAIHLSGDGGPELGRYDQLNELTKLLYTMAQESPECAGAVWARRLGVLHNAHAKRLRDAELRGEGDDDTAWPSTGVVLLLRALGHVFPVTDKRHYVVTPALLLLGQMIAHTPVASTYDLVMGIMCSGLLIEFNREAKRVAPEAISFISGAIRLFAAEESDRTTEMVIPTLGACANDDFAKRLRNKASKASSINTKISLDAGSMKSNGIAAGILCSLISMAETVSKMLDGALESSEREALQELAESILCLKPNSKKSVVGNAIKSKIAAAAKAVSDACQYDSQREPLTRRAGAKIPMIKTLAPKMEDPDRYKQSKDKGKTATQANLDRTRRELKREKKAVARELRLDAAFVEAERRSEREQKDSAARAKRQKAFAWMEAEQGTMNQQVRQGGGLLTGGGTGAARAKARTGKIGTKKGGKF